MKPESITKEQAERFAELMDADFGRFLNDYQAIPVDKIANALIEAGIVSPRESIEFDEICLRRAIEISKTGVYGYSMAHVGLEPLLSVIKARIAEKRGKNDQA